MVDLLKTSVAEGGLGFSSTVSPTHNDGEGRPVPSRHASRDELVTLAGAIRDLPGTTLEFLPGVGEFTDEQKALMTDLSLAAKRPLNWNVLAPSAANADYVEAQLSATDYARERGAEVLVGRAGDEAVVRRAPRRGRLRCEPAVRAPVLGEPLEHALKRRLGRRLGERGPAAGETPEVHEVEVRAVAEALEVAAHRVVRRRDLERDQPLQGEHRVVEVRTPRAVQEAPLRVALRIDEVGDELRRITQQPRR